MTNQEAMNALSMLEEFFFCRSMDPKDLGSENADGLRAISGAMKTALFRFHTMTGLNVEDVTGIQFVPAARAD